jgi:hypothetical protein
VDGQAIGAGAISQAELRSLPTEQGGPRPAGVRSDSLATVKDGRMVRATRP